MAVLPSVAAVRRATPSWPPFATGLFIAGLRFFQLWLVVRARLAIGRLWLFAASRAVRHRRLVFLLKQRFELAFAVHSRQPHAPLELFAVAAEDNRHSPADRISAEHVLERVRRCDFPVRQIAIAHRRSAGRGGRRHWRPECRRRPRGHRGPFVTVAPNDAWSTIRPLFSRPRNRLIWLIEMA